MSEVEGIRALRWGIVVNRLPAAHTGLRPGRAELPLDPAHAPGGAASPRRHSGSPARRGDRAEAQDALLQEVETSGILNLPSGLDCSMSADSIAGTAFDAVTESAPHRAGEVSILP